MLKRPELPKLLRQQQKLAQLIADAADVRSNIRHDMSALKAKGVIHARAHWRNERYLYLLYPLVQGQPRKREYIGSDPERIRSAQESIERAQQYEVLSKKLDHLDAAVARASQYVSAAVNELKKV